MFVVVAFITVSSHWEFESLSLGKASCDRTVHAGWFSVSRIRLYQAIMIFLSACVCTRDFGLQFRSKAFYGCMEATQKFDSGELN